MCGPKGHPTGSAYRAFVSAALASILLLGHAASGASEPLIRQVAIVERGIYLAEPTGQTATVGTLGAVQHIRNAKLVESTTQIPGRKMVRFGVRYVVHGVPRRAQVEIRMVTRFPDSRTPGPDHDRLKDLQSEYVVQIPLGTVGYRDFLFDDVREIIPGEWSFEFWFGASKVGEQKFCVYEVTVKRRARSDGCVAAVALLH